MKVRIWDVTYWDEKGVRHDFCALNLKVVFDNLDPDYLELRLHSYITNAVLDDHIEEAV